MDILYYSFSTFHVRKKLFGPSTEVSQHVDGQLSLFDTAQQLAQKLAKEQKKITVPAHTRKARQPGVRAEMLSGLVQEMRQRTENHREKNCPYGSGIHTGKVKGKADCAASCEMYKVRNR